MLSHYFSTALRNFARFKLSTGINVLCLTVGLVCFIAAIAVARYMQSSDRQWEKADRIVVITERLSNPERGFDTGVLTDTSPPIAKHLRADVPELEAVARIEDIDDDVALVAADGSKVSARVAGAEGEFLHIFDFPFLAGNARDGLGQPGSIVLTEALARRLFGTRNALGQSVLLENSTEVTVTGVMKPVPQPSQFGSSPNSLMRFEALVSIDVLNDLTRKARGRSRDEDAEVNQWGSLPFTTYALLPENGSVTQDSLNTRLTGFAERHAPSERVATTTYEFGAAPASSVWIAGLNANLMRGTGVSITTVLQLLASLVLFMSCVNYANSATAQAIARTKETGVRRVLGANRSQVFMQYVFEAALLTLTALSLSVVFLALMMPFLEGAFGIRIAVLLDDPLLTILFLTCVAVVVSMTAGIYPGLMLAKVQPIESLRAAKNRPGNALLPRILVGLQFGAASLLLIAVSIIYLQNSELRRIAMNPDVDPVVAIANDLRTVKLDFATLRTELLKIPAVRSVSMIGELPWIGGIGTLVLARSQDKSADELQPLFHIVSHDFASTLNIPLLAGRSFDREHGDDLMPTTDFRKLDTTRAYSIVIDRAASERLGWTPEEAAGQLISIPFSRVGMGVDQPVRIIGVVENKPLLVRAPATGIDTTMYVLLPPGIGYPIVRIDRRDIPGALQAIDETWNKLAPAFPVNRRFMDELFGQAYVTYGRVSQIVAVLTFAAFTVAALGLFGMASFVASRRIHEVGIRKTLGASSPQIVSLLLRDFSTPVVIANLAAWPLAYFAAQSYLANFLSRISLTPAPFIASFLITLLIAWIAVSSQTLRAARLNPGTVLRYE